MTIVSNKKFKTNQKKYYNLAVNDEVFIEKANNMFHLMCASVGDKYNDEEVYLEPDDDLRNAMTIEEVREKLYGVVDKLFANK